MSCQVEQIADCGDLSSLGRALFIFEKEDPYWLSQCSISLSSCGSLLAVGHKDRLCLLTSQWISAMDSNTFLISWSGTLPSDITSLLVLPICPSHHSTQNGPDWFCVIVGFKNGSVGFYTNTGHLLFTEKLEDKPVMKISCHTGTYGTLPDDIHILYQHCECIITGSNLFQTLRYAKAQLAKVQAGVGNDYTIDTRNIHIRKWTFTEQEAMNDAAVVGIELKNSYDHLLAASTYGGYDTWYRSVPPVNTLILGAGAGPYLGFHYALEGGNTIPLQDVARVVASKIKSALPGWLGGGSVDNTATSIEPLKQSEPLSMRSGMYDATRHGTTIAVSPDRRLAAVTDSLGRVAILDVNKGHLIKMFKGNRDAQCAFVQIFEADNKKPQLSIVKELRRAIFLIIYNPKKGLIDIRLMQKGTRVAVFTATKNGVLLYNTCGLVGAERNFTHKKLNLPEFQCVLMDPDGKLKRFCIPFFYALDGEHSERSKDLHILRDLRDYIKKSSASTEDYKDEIIQRAMKLKTLSLKKHCLEMLVRNYDTPPVIVMSCLMIFWEEINKCDLTDEQINIKHYFVNLARVTLFYRYLRGEITDDMLELIAKITEDTSSDSVEESIPDEENENLEFHLLEDDNCILERLLSLAQESDYKERHARVTFADNNTSTYKEFVSCFLLEDNSPRLSLKTDIATEKLGNLSLFMFTSIMKLKDPKVLCNYIKNSNVEAKEIVKLLIMHLMSISIEELSVDLIEKFIGVLYYVCSVTEEATKFEYNESSEWWQSVRDMLVEMSCPLRSMIVAMSCKVVGWMFENKGSERDEDTFESVTEENAKWGLLIGKLEDISMLSIVVMSREKFKGKHLPKLEASDFNINLKNIYTRGKGSVTELIAKWLCTMGVLPEAIVANELMDVHAATDFEKAEDDRDYIYIENNRIYVEENLKIFKSFSLLRRQFPLSTKADYIISNMCWEYATAWQKSISKTANFDAIVHCITIITDLHLRLGLFSIIWSTHIRNVFEVACRLVNKVGILPKDALCTQDVGLNSTDMVIFLELCTSYLENFIHCSKKSVEQEKREIQFEKIWEESMPSLVEVAQNTKNVNDDILNLNYQVACTICYQCQLNFKYSKPLDVLFDFEFQFIIDGLTANVAKREINMKSSEKSRNPRMKYLTKVIRAAIDTVTSEDTEGPRKVYHSEECSRWIKKCCELAEMWNVEVDFVHRQQVIGLYHMGFDSLAEKAVSSLREPEIILTSVIAITIQRLKRSLETCSNQAEWIVTVPAYLYKRMQSVTLDTSVPANPSLATTVTVLQKLLYQVDQYTKDTASHAADIKLTKTIIESAQVLQRRRIL